MIVDAHNQVWQKTAYLGAGQPPEELKTPEGMKRNAEQRRLHLLYHW